MANKDSAFGLRRVKGPSKQVKCVVDAGYATALFKGDPVIKVAGGSNAAVVTCGTETHEIGTLPAVEKAALGDGNLISGVIESIDANPDNLTLNYSPASTQAVVTVEMHPDAIFEIQASAAIPAASVGLNAVLLAGTGSTVTGLSGIELDATTDVPAVDPSNQLNIIKVSDDMQRNDVTASNTVVEVTINQHTERTPQSGI